MTKELFLRRFEIKDPSLLYLCQKEHYIKMMHRYSALLYKVIHKSLLSASPLIPEMENIKRFKSVQLEDGSFNLRGVYSIAIEKPLLS